MTSIEQIVRIGLFTVGGYFLGDGVASSAEYQQAVGAAIQLGTFAWWFYRNRQTR